jgi:hypothetical protein
MSDGALLIRESLDSERACGAPKQDGADCPYCA